jgi:prepilin-type N-terminal cleavage/methylation domain-containing protein
MEPTMTSRTGKITSRRNQSAGFTLLELLLVITLLGLLFGIAIPRFRGSYETARLEAAGEIVKRSVHAARSVARTSGETWDLVWDPFAYEIIVLPRERGGSAVDGGIDPDAEIVFPAQDLPQELLVRWSTYRVTFYPDGRAEPAWVEIENRRGMRLRIKIEEYGTKVSKNSQ